MWEVRTFCLFGGYINTWIDNEDYPVTYATEQEARHALACYLWETRDLRVLDGERMHHRVDFQIAEVTA